MLLLFLVVNVFVGKGVVVLVLVVELLSVLILL